MERRQNNFIKHRTTANDSILKLLGPSVLGIIVCMICLAGASWAWFTAGVQSQSTIGASSYTLEESVSVKTERDSEASSGDVVEKSADGTYHLLPNQAYTVTLKPETTPTNGGYCIIKLTYKDGENDHTVKYYTKSLKSGVSFNFTISNGGTEATCQLLAAWGNPENLDVSDSHGCSSGDILKINGGVTETSSDEAGNDKAEDELSKSTEDSGKEASSKTASSDAKTSDASEGQKDDNRSANSADSSKDDGSADSNADSNKTDRESGAVAEES